MKASWYSNSTKKNFNKNINKYNQSYNKQNYYMTNMPNSAPKRKRHKITATDARRNSMIRSCLFTMLELFIILCIWMIIWFAPVNVIITCILIVVACWILLNIVAHHEGGN